jgi:hypothetical protein
MLALVSGAIDLASWPVARRGSKDACSRAVLPARAGRMPCLPNLVRLSRISIADAIREEYRKRVFRE